MAIAIVQKAQGYANANSLSVAFGSNNTAGNLLIAIGYINFSYGPDATISDTLGNAWVQIPYYTGFTPWDHGALAWVCLDAKAGANTVTVGYSLTNYLMLQVYEVGGWSRGASLNTSGHNSNAGGSTANPSATTDHSAFGGDYALAYCWVLDPSGYTTYPYTAGSGFAIEQQEAATFGLHQSGEDGSVSTGGPLTAAFGISASANVQWGCYVLDFSDNGGVQPQMFVVT